jgi:hypothetical protein
MYCKPVQKQHALSQIPELLAQSLYYLLNFNCCLFRPVSCKYMYCISLLVSCYFKYSVPDLFFFTQHLFYLFCSISLYFILLTKSK